MVNASLTRAGMECKYSPAPLADTAHLLWLFIQGVDIGVADYLRRMSGLLRHTYGRLTLLCLSAVYLSPAPRW